MPHRPVKVSRVLQPGPRQTTIGEVLEFHEMPHHPKEVAKAIQPVQTDVKLPLTPTPSVSRSGGRKDVNSCRCASRPCRGGEGNLARNSTALASLMAEPMRVRLEFEDHRRLLTKSQRKDGLRCCWILLGPQLPTVADLAAHLVRSFALDRSCPRGIRLYERHPSRICLLPIKKHSIEFQFGKMDEFVLPPFESRSIFRDKDIIRAYEHHRQSCF
ncbi:cytochrome P450 [Musa troglodytarum]|uniref:Cytochrome P450 n=1 Tax=Musa troglodytarum TaxID=320322 RepID=A0A9E7HP67_9LILI|nr:cytochrome P450 [Musa troglodytarum]